MNESILDTDIFSEIIKRVQNLGFDLKLDNWK